MNVCGCGYQPGAAGHDPACPYPLFRGGMDDWREWTAAYEERQRELEREQRGDELDADDAASPCPTCGGSETVGPFEMDGMSDGTYHRRGLWWLWCRACQRHHLVRKEAATA